MPRSLCSILILAAATDECNSRTGNRFRSELYVLGRRRRQRHVLCAALLTPMYSAFMALFLSEHDGSLIIVCGLDHRSFRSLLQIFKPINNMYTPYSEDGSIRVLLDEKKRWRPESMNALKCLAYFSCIYEVEEAEHFFALPLA